MFYEFIRPLTCPFEKIQEFVPTSGKIMDVGCGHGLFTKILAQSFPKRWVLGIDPSEEKIQQAIKSKPAKNLKFKTAELEDIKEKFDCITVIDMLYLFPREEKLKFLKKGLHFLSKKGYIEILSQLGFRIKRQMDLKSILPYPHFLLTAQIKV